MTIFAVVKLKCAVEKVMCALRSAEILVRILIYLPIISFGADVNPA